MAIIGKVERKNWKVKILNICIHLLLLLGAVTMIYPLLIMISGSIKSNVDFFSFSPIVARIGRNQFYVLQILFRGSDEFVCQRTTESWRM